MRLTTLKILNEIENNGYIAYAVGGFVRDSLLNIKTLDVDICTNAKPKELKEIFKDAKMAGVEYGAISLRIKNIDYEITTFRREIKYENNRKPIEIEYINDLYFDLLRRDFTINTLCMDKRGNIIDLLRAKKDLFNKVIKTVGDANKKLKEDSLRILRAIRFATTLNFNLDKELEQAIINNKHLLKTLSYERKKSELSKIFASTNKKYGIDLIKKFDLEKELGLINIDYALKTDDLIGIWSIITGDYKYIFTKIERDQCKKLRELLTMNLSDDYVLYTYGLYLSTLASDILGLNKKDIIKRYNKLIISNRNDLDIDIKEICKLLSKAPSKFLKDLVLDVEKKVIYKELNNNKQDIEKYIVMKYTN